MEWSKVASALVGAGIAGTLSYGGYTIKIDVVQTQADHTARLVGAIATQCPSPARPPTDGGTP